MARNSMGLENLGTELEQQNFQQNQDRDEYEGDANPDENEDENYEGTLNYGRALQVFNQVHSDGLDGNSLEGVRRLEERLKFIALLDEQENELQARILQQQEQLDMNQGLEEYSQQQTSQIQRRQEQEIDHFRGEKGQTQGISAVPSLIVSSPNAAQKRQSYDHANIQQQQVIGADNFSSNNSQAQFSPQTGSSRNFSSVIPKINFQKTPPVGNSSDQNKQNTKNKTKLISSPSPSYARPKQVHEATTIPSIEYTFQPQINSKSKKLAQKVKKTKDLSGKYLYEDFLLRREKQTENEDKELALAEAQRSMTKISSNSQKIILSKIDRALSGIIESLQEGEFLAYHNLAQLYSQIQLFSAFQLNTIDQNRASPFLKKDKKQFDVARLNSEMIFLQQSYRILSLSTPEQGVPKKLIFDFLMVLFETKIQITQTVQILTDVLLVQLGIVTSEVDSQENKDAFIKALINQSLSAPEIGQVDNGRESLGENWDLNQVVLNFRKLYSDKTSLMEWYSSRNSNSQGNYLAGQNCSKCGNNSKCMKCMHENTDFKFRPEISKKSKFLDSCLLKARENSIRSCNRSANSGNEYIKSNSSSCVDKNRFQLLFEDSKYLQQKKKENEEAALREQQINCTFKPLINLSSKGCSGQMELSNCKNRNEQASDTPNLKCHDQQQNQTIHERLYQHYSKKSEALGEVIQAAEAEKVKQELQECTFKPTINSSNQINSPSKNSKIVNNENKSVDNIKGVMQQLERLQKARAVQLEKESFFERQRQSLGQSYTGLTETIPFSFDNNEIHNGQSVSRRERQIIGNVEVNLSKGKKGRIVVCKGDNPEKLAGNFAKIYSLNEDMKMTLAEMLAGYIQKIKEDVNHGCQEKQIGQSQELLSNEEYSRVESVNQVVSTIVVEEQSDQQNKEPSENQVKQESSQNCS